MSDANEGGAGKFRSPPFPFIPLDRAVTRAQQLYQQVRDLAVPVSIAAKAWGLSPTSSSAIQSAAALKQFGLIDEDGAGLFRKIRLTKLGLRLALDKRQESPEVKDALKAAALMPKIHRELFDAFGASLPSDDAVTHHLIVDRKLAGQAAFSHQSAADLIREYATTIEFAGLADGGSMSLDDGERVPEGVGSSGELALSYPALEGSVQRALVPTTPVRQEVPVVAGERVVFVEEGGPSQYVKLVAAGPLDEILLDAITDYVARQKRRLQRGQSNPIPEETPTALLLPS